ncbi:unnamed protein product [Lymnaea stagnalis]|uniref:Uncharacterized protein n=1 Tax=Lymnaea stagnalis TaxID=6523 RepID=A0AAV2IBD7_LYMST
MYDLVSVREVCREYSASSARVDRSLQTLRLEMMSLRRQDVALLKQLVTINDVIKSLRTPSHPGAAPPPLLQSNSIYHNRTLADFRARLSIKRTPPEKTGHGHTRTIRECSGTIHRESVATGNMKTPTSNPTTLNNSQSGTEKAQVGNKIHRQICENEPHTAGHDAHVRPRAQTLGRTTKEINTEFDLRCRTASTDTIASQSDSAYGSGSDLDDSQTCLNTVTPPSPFSSIVTSTPPRPTSHPIPSHNSKFSLTPSMSSKAQLSSRNRTNWLEEEGHEDNYERMLKKNMHIWRVSKVEPVVTDL